MKLTVKILKEMIREELKESNRKDPFRPTAAGRAVSGLRALARFHSSDPDEFAMGVLALLMLTGGGAFTYAAKEAYKNQEYAARQISQMTKEEIEEQLEKVEPPDITNKSSKKRRKAEEDLKAIKIYTADRISKMSEEEIMKKITSAPFKTIYRNMEKEAPPEDQLRIQPEREPYKESLKRRRARKN